MKRYNIHLPIEWDIELGKIVKRINTERRKDNFYTDIKKADVIRIGIAITYNLTIPYFYRGSESTIKIIENLFQKKSKK